MDVKEREPLMLRELTDGNTVLNDHDDAAGLCAVCGSAWPCDTTLLAGELR
ncbi:hypothetical protein [Jiangella mangrovi]|uniref:Uncharacterized protein n=1 Tax=Jiangella mangrovi TaxID=1524084 RepID=A0A7W9LKQ6_9ACTN|nr:hypothetical protein [Jiangella mangrovi]MBB5787361.1 hypothetical protein [Jiangella mangrovi]